MINRPQNANANDCLPDLNPVQSVAQIVANRIGQLRPGNTKLENLYDVTFGVSVVDILPLTQIS